jgi:flagellar biogenesis protein FliO
LQKIFGTIITIVIVIVIIYAIIKIIQFFRGSGGDKEIRIVQEPAK